MQFRLKLEKQKNFSQLAPTQIDRTFDSDRDLLACQQL
jgi:hypothetical protein